MPQHYTARLQREVTTIETQVFAWDGQADSPEHAREQAESATPAWVVDDLKIIEIDPVEAVEVTAHSAVTA